MQLLLIDANNIGYASMYIPALSSLSHEGQATGGILGVIQSAMRLIQKFPGSVPFLLWDGHASWRKDILPEYKANRKDPAQQEVAQSWERQRAIASILFLHLGIPQIRAADAEADDLAGFLTRAIDRSGQSTVRRIALASGDTDWWQAISPKVTWLSPITDKLVTLDSLRSDQVKDGPFLSPDEYLEAKIIAGDSSDNIPGVSGVGLKTACKLLRQHVGTQGIIAAVEQGRAKDKRSISIAEHAERIAVNRRIMDWRHAPTIATGSWGILRSSFCMEDFRTEAQAWGLQRLLDRFGSGDAWQSWEQSIPWGDALDFVESTITEPAPSQAAPSHAEPSQAEPLQDRPEKSVAELDDSFWESCFA